jgi:adenine-specific DNA methylase
MTDDRRLIEDYLPIEAISEEASREKSVRKGHISTLHLWWARRPLVACRAAVYGALVPASQFVPACADEAGRPKNAKGDLPAAPGESAAQAGTTWGGLAEEVRYWGNWVLEKVRAEIGDLYPPIPDPEY